MLRPDHFAEPAAAPLPAAPPARPSSPPAPRDRPLFDQPQPPVAPLESLVPPVPDVRDPTAPFDVASAAVTDASSAWSAAHWNPPSGPPVLAGPGASAGAPVPFAATAAFSPTAPFPSSAPSQAGAPAGPGAPAAFPSAPSPSAPYAPFPPPRPTAAGPFPAPGTAEWFSPPPPPYPTPAPATGTGPAVIAQTLTIGVVVTLAVGGVVWPLAPVAFAVAFGLASRVRLGRPAVLGLFTAAAAVLVVVGLVAALISDGFFSDSWDLLARWAQVLCWVVLVAAWVLVWRALRGSAPGAGPPPTVWG